jgi:hypothetical protein
MRIACSIGCCLCKTAKEVYKRLAYAQCILGIISHIDISILQELLQQRLDFVIQLDWWRRLLQKWNHDTDRFGNIKSNIRNRICSQYTSKWDDVIPNYVPRKCLCHALLVKSIRYPERKDGCHSKEIIWIFTHFLNFWYQG